MFEARNPRKEAQSLLPQGYEGRVLEPSPPAVNQGEYLADDPLAPDGRDPTLTLVGPSTNFEVTWDALARHHSQIGPYTADHWLGSWKRLEPLPEPYTPTVASLNQLAFHALAPARYAAQGKIGLRYTFGGFGTPFFAQDRQIRIEGDHLVIQEGDSISGETITTLGRAAEFSGVEFRERWGPEWDDPPVSYDPDRLLEIKLSAVSACSNIFGFAFSILEQLRAEAEAADKASRVQLWPEHFDAAVEIGNDDRKQRAGFGVSPGYAAHPEPFVYVSPWAKDRLTDPYWNADFFGGSIFRYSDLLKADDQREAALDFLRAGRELLRRS